MRFVSNIRVWLFLLLVTAAAALTGCATSDSENASARPWNAPYNWENGLPANITEGR